MSSEWPLPSTRKGWVLAAVLLLFAFFLYYFFLYPDLERDYYRNFWHNPSSSGGSFSGRSSGKVEVETYTPRYLASFVEQEMWLLVRNCSTATLEIEVRLTVPVHPPDVVVTWRGEQTSAEFGSETISLGEVPPSATVRIGVWVKVRQIYVKPIGAAGDSAAGDRTVKFGVDVRSRQPGTQNDGDWPKFEPVHASGLLEAKVDAASALFQSFIKVILLPPWSNALLPALVLFIVWCCELWVNVQPQGKWRFWKCLRACCVPLLVVVGVLLFFTQPARLWFRLSGEADFLCPLVLTVLSLFLFIGVPILYGLKVRGGRPLQGYDDLPRLLKDPSAGYIILAKLQQYHPSLPEFERYLTLLEGMPAENSMEVVTKSIQATPSHRLGQCSDEFLRKLLAWAVSTDAVRESTLSDGTRLLDSLLNLGSPGLDEAFCQYLGKSQMVDAVLDSLRSSARPVDDVLRFLDAIPEYDREQWKKVFLALAPEQRRNEVVRRARELQRFLENRARRCGGPLTVNLPPPALDEFLDIGTYVAERNLPFAEWFVLQELVHLPNDRNDVFKSHLARIVSVPRPPSIGSFLRCKPMLFQLVSQVLMSTPETVKEHLGKIENNNLRERLRRLVDEGSCGPEARAEAGSPPADGGVE